MAQRHCLELRNFDVSTYKFTYRLPGSGPGMTPIRKSQGAALQSTFGTEEGSLPRSMGHIMGCRGNATWDSSRFTVGCLEKELNVRKEREVVSLYKTKKKKCGAIR